MNRIIDYNRCKFKHIYRQLLAGLMVATLFFVAGCLNDQAPDAASENGDDMFANGKDVEAVADDMRTTPEGIPSIDGQVPEELETATLAMG